MPSDFKCLYLGRINGPGGMLRSFIDLIPTANTLHSKRMRQLITEFLCVPIKVSCTWKSETF